MDRTDYCYRKKSNKKNGAIYYRESNKTTAKRAGICIARIIPVVEVLVIGGSQENKHRKTNENTKII